MRVVARKMKELVQSMIGIRTTYVDEDGQDEETENVDVQEPKFEQKPPSKRGKIIPLGANNNSRESIGIVLISSFNEIPAITSALKARQPVIFSVDALEFAEARRVVDYVAGTVHGIDGDIKKIQDKSNIFVAVPSHISVETIAKTNEKMKEVVGVDIAL